MDQHEVFESTLVMETDELVILKKEQGNFNCDKETTTSIDV